MATVRCTCSARVGAQLQFLQFYLAATILTALPVVADMQKRRALVAALRGSEERFRLLAEHSTDVLMHLTLDGRIRYVSRLIEQYGGYPADALAGRKSTELIAPEDIERVRAEHRRVLQSRGAVVKFRCLGLMADGEKRWFETHSRALLDEHGSPEGVLSIARDVNEQVLREQGLLDAAMTDTLTALPNRRAFTRAVQARSREAGGKPGDCIALFDIDHFKRVNDSYGHPVGDRVLQAFASAASEAVRRDDVVARFGGEEFVILLPDTSREQALQVCERLSPEIAGLRLFAAGEVFRVTVSGGVAELGHAGLSEALQAADKALYEAKNGGRDRLALAA